jgi:hypothetical protein
MLSAGVEQERTVAQGAATMEITVSRQDLLRELSATQSVVERKTTIPILSNFLLEARPPDDYGDRPGPEHSHVLYGQSEEARCLHHPGAQTF